MLKFILSKNFPSYRIENRRFEQKSFENLKLRYYNIGNSKIGSCIILTSFIVYFSKHTANLSITNYDYLMSDGYRVDLRLNAPPPIIYLPRIFA